MKNIDVFNFLNEKFPVSDAMPFDNPGFLVGDRNAEVSKILVALDCEINAVSKAMETGCSLIVTHHPVIFDGLKAVTEDSVVYKLIKNGIAVISMHTNMDVGEGGVNDCLCEAAGLENVRTYIANDGFRLRIGETAPVSAGKFAAHIKEKLGGRVKYTDSGREIRRVMVCGGSGGEFLNDAILSACDALLTADIKHNVFIDAVNKGFSVFDAGHFNTEDVIVEPLVSLLQRQFFDLDVISYHPDIIYFE